MALDPSIILQAGRGVTPLMSQAEIEDQQTQRELGGMKLSQLRQGMQDDATQRQIAQSTNPNDLAGAYYKAGLVKPAQEAMKFQTEQQKAQREAKKAEIEGYLKQFEVAGQIFNNVKDQASWDRARQETARVFGPEKAAQMPAQYDPALVAENQAKAMTVKQQLEQKWKEMEYTTPNANAQLSAQTARQGQAMTAANQAASLAQSETNSLRTDARARDLNATKVEDNRIKREAKDDTANLTKASQIASFDTMLGTLDRLAVHPGLKNSVGLVGALPTMPGSDSANFQAELNTFQSQAFLPMVAQLKGMGALSDAEGKKLTAAVGALDPKMGEKAFRDSVGRITSDMNAARMRMTGGQARNPETPGGPQKIADKAAFDALPSGTTFIAPDGSTRRKP